jgi:uncharacterized protein (TIGR02231 family)
MRSSIKVLLLALLATPLGSASAQPANGDDASTVTSKISEVTVYADRARVTRTGTVGMRAGTMRFAFRKLPGWIDEGSVRVSLNPPTAGELVDVQVERTFLARPDDEEIRKAQDAVTEITDQLAALDDEVAALDAQTRQTDAIRVFSLDKLPKDAAVREVKVEEYGSVVKYIGDSMLEISKSRRVIEKKRRDQQPELRARQQKLADLRQRSQLEQRTVFVVVKGARDAEAAVALTYLVPGTTWEPVHELRADQSGASLSVASYAVVTQTTGEDWEGATLTFSTQRPNETARIPELEAQLLGNSRSLARIINDGDTFQVAVANFTAQNSIWNGAANSGRLDVQQGWDANVREQQVRQRRNIEVFQQVQQQRGTTAQFPSLGAQTVRTDGRTVRVPIGTAKFASVSRIVAAPEVSLNAVQTADLDNTSGQPLLPGKVLLFAEGAFVGTTETEFVAPGEDFSMFLGVADHIKLSRTLDQKRSSLTWTGKRKRMLASFVVTVENLAGKPVVLQLNDRIPVSEIEDIRVMSVKLQPDVKPDVKGLIKWDVTLPAKTKKEFRLEYTLDYPPELPATAAANAGTAPSYIGSGGRGGGAKTSGVFPSSNPPGQFPSSSIYQQIDVLEKSLKK